MNFISTQQLPVLFETRPLLVFYHLQPAVVMSTIDPRQIMRFSVNKQDNYQAYNAWKEKFKERLHRTKLNDTDLEVELSIDTYQDKFYTLLCFEEMEHINLLTDK